MKVLKSGKNAGCAVYYFQIGFQCDGYFNNVVETANENSVENLVETVNNLLYIPISIHYRQRRRGKC